jgi:hypothetical protein
MPAQATDCELDIDAIHELYLRMIRDRSLIDPESMRSWMGRQVTVYLRHESVDRFLIEWNHSEAGFANFVELADARFLVDQASRQKTLDRTGPLPNRRTIHACIVGKLLDVRCQAPEFLRAGLKPVIYNPTKHTQFMDAVTGREIHFSPRVFCVCERTKVWCQ